MKSCINCKWLIADGWGPSYDWRCGVKQEITEDLMTPNTCPKWMYEPGTDPAEIDYDG